MHIISVLLALVVRKRFKFYIEEIFIHFFKHLRHKVQPRTWCFVSQHLRNFPTCDYRCFMHSPMILMTITIMHSICTNYFYIFRNVFKNNIF